MHSGAESGSESSGGDEDGDDECADQGDGGLPAHHLLEAGGVRGLLRSLVPLVPGAGAVLRGRGSACESGSPLRERRRGEGGLHRPSQPRRVSQQPHPGVPDADRLHAHQPLQVLPLPRAAHGGRHGDLPPVAALPGGRRGHHESPDAQPDGRTGGLPTEGPPHGAAHVRQLPHLLPRLARVHPPLRDRRLAHRTLSPPL